MRIALAQMNSHLGHFDHNVQKILNLCEEAANKKCQLIVFPELNILGYHPQDLLERPSVIENQNKAIEELLKKLPPGLFCLVGAATKNHHRGKPYFNSALLLQGNKILRQFNKELLPVYDVFDDSRHFAEGQLIDNQFHCHGKHIQVLICEDMWGWDDLHEKNPILCIPPNQVDLVVNLSASPFTPNKKNQRLFFARKTVDHLKAPLIYVNMVGGQDELIFDGGSFAMDEQFRLLAESAYCVEDFNIVDFNEKKGGCRPSPRTTTEHLHQVLVLGLRDFILKTGFEKAHLGLSGGIDSAVTACLLADAIGSENLTAMTLPTNFNSRQSADLAKNLAKNIGCQIYNLSIQESYETLVRSYENCFGPKNFSLIHENIQARLRGIFLMAYSNEHRSLLIATGNKNEYATGYTTLYGDMCGGLAPLADLLKSQIYELAHYYNKIQSLIPGDIITRPPTAELKENQKDSDSLPDYNFLDPSIDRLVCHRETAQSKTDQWLLKQLYRSEFKRWQAPPILKVSDHAFGQGRRMPIAHRTLEFFE